MTKRSVPPTASGRGSPGPAGPHGPGADAAEPPEAASQRTFRPGPGLVVVLAGTGMVVVLALGAAVSNALGAHGVAALLGGASLVVVGLALLAVLRVPVFGSWTLTHVCLHLHPVLAPVLQLCLSLRHSFSLGPSVHSYAAIQSNIHLCHNVSNGARD